MLEKLLLQCLYAFFSMLSLFFCDFFIFFWVWLEFDVNGCEYGVVWVWKFDFWSVGFVEMNDGLLFILDLRSLDYILGSLHFWLKTCVRYYESLARHRHWGVDASNNVRNDVIQCRSIRVGQWCVSVSDNNTTPPTCMIIFSYIYFFK